MKTTRIIFPALVSGYLLSVPSIAFDNGKAAIQASSSKTDKVLEDAEAK